MTIAFAGNGVRMMGTQGTESVFLANPFAGVNPFATPDEGGDLRFTYAMLKRGPEVTPDEVEVTHASAIEVMVLWDSNVLHVSHLDSPRSFVVGEETSEKAGVDYFIPGETLGRSSAPVVVPRGVGAALVILPRSRGYVDVPGLGKVKLADLIASGSARPSAEVSGAHEYDLPTGARARMELEGSALAFEVGVVPAGKKLGTGLRAAMEPATVYFTSLSFLLHVGLVAIFAFFMPPMHADDSETMDRDRIMMMQKLLNSDASPEQAQVAETGASQTTPESNHGGSASPAPSGAAGHTNAVDKGHAYGNKGPKDNPDPQLARQAAVDEASKFGMIGLAPSALGGDPDAPTVPWGREVSSGFDSKSARGALFGDTIGDAIGTGGVNLTGAGEGCGGHGTGIGIGNMGGLGHGGGTGTGDGIGHGKGNLARAHESHGPVVHEGVSTVNGHLPAEVIQRIVRQNFGRFRVCYENGLRGNPGLEGRVAVKFVIDRSGAVSLTTDGGSDLPDQGVVQCVVRAFGSLSFPSPENGMVTVVYPIAFSGGE